MIGARLRIPNVREHVDVPPGLEDIVPDLVARFERAAADGLASILKYFAGAWSDRLGRRWR